MKLTDREWKIFEIQNIFKVVNLKAEHKVNLKTPGTIPYITRTEKNNGIESFYKGMHVKKGNCITFGAETAKFYYQEYSFINGNKLYAIYNDNLNKFNSLFLTTLFNNQFSNYGYGFGLTGTRFAKKKIKLPTIDGSPDFKFMEEYIKKRYFNAKNRIKKYKKTTIDDLRELKDIEWKNFSIQEIFDTKIGKNVNGNKVNKLSGELPYVTRKETYNGIAGFLNEDKKIISKLNIINRPVITIGNETAQPYVQNYNFYTGTKVNILTPKEIVNVKALKFIAQSLQQHKEKYSYSFTINSSRLKKQIIKLPTKDGKPDYKFMEQYMKRKENEILDRL
mgnify:FL=1